MASVVVHDIDQLESFMGVLQARRDELEELYGALVDETNVQSSNWQDPQYDHLKDIVDSYCSLCQSQLSELEDSIGYIAGLVVKLRDL